MRHTLPDDTTPVRDIQFHDPRGNSLATVTFEARIGDSWIAFRGWRIRRRGDRSGIAIDPPALRAACGAFFPAVTLPVDVLASIRDAIREAWELTAVGP